VADRNSGSMYGSVDLLILKTLSLGGPKHGLEIIEEVRLLSNDQLKIELKIEGNALYPSLHRLERKGLVGSEWRISEKGRRARFYLLTPAGTKRLQKGMKEWIRHADAVRLVFDIATGGAS